MNLVRRVLLYYLPLETDSFGRWHWDDGQLFAPGEHNVRRYILRSLIPFLVFFTMGLCADHTHREALYIVTFAPVAFFNAMFALILRRVLWLD